MGLDIHSSPYSIQCRFTVHHITAQPFCHPIGVGSRMGGEGVCNKSPGNTHRFLQE
jgi:hypothetical protein